MARTKRTSFAVLGMLMAGPRTGYDLKRDFDEQVSAFWAESVGQIYPTLHRLRDQGFVQSEESKDASGPRRVLYSITPNGKHALLEWLAEPAAPDTVRNELLLKVFFGNVAGSQTSIAQIRQYELALKEIKSLYARYEQEIETREVSPDRRLYWRVALLSGKFVNDAKLAWCREAISLIEQNAQSESAK
ncbi:MAG: PadR family transcriptional regulator [Phycisphaerae bacterium]